MSQELRSLIPVAGAIFLAAPDPIAAAALVETRLTHTDTDSDLADIELAGVASKVLAEYVDLLPNDPEQLRLVLTCGAAWAMGLRAAPADTSRWRPVVSGSGLGPPDFSNRTGETLVQLAMSARRELRFAPGYIDIPAAQYLGPSIAAASKRGVMVRLLIVEQLERGLAGDELRNIVTADGATEHVYLHRASANDWFAHMKVLSVDGRAAYIGSANSTLAGLSTNFELGALVEGPAVATINAFLDRVSHAIDRSEH